MKTLLPAAAALLIIALALLYLRQQDLGEHAHARFQDALWEARQLDAGFNETLLRARFSLLTTYDDFETSRRRSAELLERLDHVPPFVTPDAGAEIAGLVGEYRALIARRHELTERFKSKNAVVANSRRYLPVATEQLMAELHTNERDRELATVVNRLTRSLLADPDSSATRERAATLRRWIEANADHPQAAFVGGLELHSNALLLGSTELDALTGEILVLPTAGVTSRLLQVYEAEVARALIRAQHYRHLLYLVVAGLFAGGIYVLWAQRTANRRLARNVRRRTHQLAESERRFRTLASAAPIGIFLTDAQGQGIYCNPFWQRTAGVSFDDALGDGWMRALHPDDAAAVASDWRRAAHAGRSFDREVRYLTPAGVRDVHVRTAPVTSDRGEIVAYVGTAEDITERKRISAELEQAQKLESVGRLAAGVAHEINTPVQYVNDNCHFLQAGFADLHTAVACYRDTLQQLAASDVLPAADAQRVRDCEAETDLGYLLEHMPRAVEHCIEGLQRVAAIVRSMKQFAHPDHREKVAADINHAVESTLTIARNEYKYVADVKTELGELPPVPCFLGDLNQAVLNIVVNAAHAIGDVVGKTGGRGLITVRTWAEDGAVGISISDNGTGIPAQIRNRIFDPFFTTKEVGKGTGQGLAIARAVVVDRHDGTLSVDTEVGRGTTFTIRLPVASAHAMESVA